MAKKKKPRENNEIINIDNTRLHSVTKSRHYVILHDNKRGTKIIRQPHDFDKNAPLRTKQFEHI